MPDPQVLYIVTGIVVLGLIIWVISALAGAGGKEQPKAKTAEPAKKPAESKPAAESAGKSAEVPPPKAAAASPPPKRRR